MQENIDQLLVAISIKLKSKAKGATTFFFSIMIVIDSYLEEKEESAEMENQPCWKKMTSAFVNFMNIGISVWTRTVMV